MLYTIAKRYSVPARKGAMVRFTDAAGKVFTGIVMGAVGASLRVKFQGMAGIKPVHPKWNLEYLDDFPLEKGMEIIYSEFDLSVVRFRPSSEVEAITAKVRFNGYGGAYVESSKQLDFEGAEKLSQELAKHLGINDPYGLEVKGKGFAFRYKLKGSTH